MKVGLPPKNPPHLTKDQELLLAKKQAAHLVSEIRSRYTRRMMGIVLGKKPGRAVVRKTGQSATPKSKELLGSVDNETVLKALGVTKMRRCRVRYFNDGAMIGSKEFVDEVFTNARERFGTKQKDGARKLKGRGASVSGTPWSLRDLRKGIS